MDIPYYAGFRLWGGGDFYLYLKWIKDQRPKQYVSKIVLPDRYVGFYSGFSFFDFQERNDGRFYIVIVEKRISSKMILAGSSFG